MFVLFLLLFTIFMIIYKTCQIILDALNKVRIRDLLDSISVKEDFKYMSYRDFVALVVELFRRKGYEVVITDKCGEDNNGLMLDKMQYVEVMEPSLKKVVEVETAKKLAKCMERNSIYRGVLVTLGDFKQNTRNFCHSNVIQCIDGEKLLVLLHEVQRNRHAYGEGGVGP